MQRRRLTPTQQIERTRNINNIEQMWVKNPRKPLRPIGIKRTLYQVTYKREKRNYAMDVHTHTALPNEHNVAMPSELDVTDFFKTQKKNPKFRTSVIASIQNGKVTGYTFIRKENSGKKPLKKLNSKGDIRVRFIPVEGYYFDKESGTFKHKQS